ncbi:ABC transporter substrate-binding protein [Paenibacillus paridis]|uniref:ABC transporter substrate-binding protein n=1 Tax=Paenibacillus paridis TaxID=2583376 RepID=UPI001120BD0A|nr:ABC transporter substrate-binding protein [Paenibacillus paridis]
MAWTGYLKKGWMTVFAAAIVLSGCGAGNDNTSESATTQPPTEESSGAANKAENESTAATRIVKDAFGELEIPTNPKRVTALYREDYLVALGVTPVVQYYNPMWGKQDYLQLEAPLFDVTGSIEALVVAEPDLIIEVGGIDEAQYEKYSKIAPTYRLSDEVLADTRQTLSVIADLMGIPEKAEKVLSDYDNRISEVKSKLGVAVGDEKIVVLRMNVADQSINIFGAKNIFVGQLLYQDLGLKAPAYAEAMTEGNMVLSQEALPELDADHIILLPSNGTWDDEGNTAALKEMLDSPIWKSLEAVKQGHIYPVERSYWQTGAITSNYKKMDELLKLLAS